MLQRIANIEVAQPVAMMPKSASSVLADALATNNRGVYKLNVPVIELGAVPKSTTYKAVNTNALESANRTVYIFNEDFLNASPAISASLLASKSYNDGFSGKLINHIIGVNMNGRGVKCKGFNIEFKDASGNQDSTALADAEFTIQSYSGIGGKTVPVVLDLAEALRNDAFQQGLLSIDCEFWINRLTQISLNLPKGYTVSVTFKWEA